MLGVGQEQVLVVARARLPTLHDFVDCNAAAEATAAAVPVVSRGLGSLSERIQHEKNGYLAYDAQDFANYSIMLMVDDARWLSMHKAMVIDRDLPTWDDRVAEWISAFLPSDLSAFPSAY